MLDQSGPGHSFEVDIWAIGVILYSLLIGKPPFETKTVEETYGRIRVRVFPVFFIFSFGFLHLDQQNNYSFPQDKPISNEAKELIKKLLHPSPAMRPKIEEIFADPFFYRRHIPAHLHCSALYEVPGAEIINSPKKSPTRKRKLCVEESVRQPQFNFNILCIYPLISQKNHLKYSSLVKTQARRKVNQREI